MTERKLGLLKRSGLFTDDLKGCTITRACSADDLRQAYRLVHDVYLGTGFINSDPSGMRLRLYETTAETATFIAKADGRVVGVLSVVQDSPELGLPSDCVFKTELDALRQQGRRLCEVTNQAVAEEYRKSGVPTELMRCAIAVSLTEGFHEAIAAVSPSHNAFYELLGFRQVGSQRSYSQTIDDPVIAVSMNIDQYRESHNGLTAAAQFIREFLTDRNQFLAQVSEWASEARRQFLCTDLLRELFVAEQSMLTRCSSADLRFIYGKWGREIFAAVMADLFSQYGDPAPEERSAPRRPSNRVRAHAAFASARSALGFSRFPACRVRRSRSAVSRS